MKNTLIGWTLEEGRTGVSGTQNPKVSEVVAALEAIRPEMKNPFIVLEAPVSEGEYYPNYCQVLADDSGYVCEVRIFNGDDFLHYRAFLPDSDGKLGDKEDPQFPSLSQAIGILTAFITDPVTLPTVSPVEWLDVSEEFAEMPA